MSPRKTAKSLKWPDTFIVKSTVGLRKNNQETFIVDEKFRRTRKELTNESKKKCKELIMKKWPGHFYYWKVPSDQKKYCRTRKELTNESEKICKELKMTGHFYGERYSRT